MRKTNQFHLTQEELKQLYETNQAYIVNYRKVYQILPCEGKEGIEYNVYYAPRFRCTGLPYTKRGYFMPVPYDFVQKYSI